MKIGKSGRLCRVRGFRNAIGSLQRVACLLLFSSWLISPLLAKDGETAKNEADASPKVGWKEVRHKGRGYVSLNDVAKFYGLTFSRDEKWVRLTDDKVRLEFITGTKGLLLNGLQFYLSYPVLPWGEDLVIVSNFDLVNVIDPTLRPSSQRDPSQLQTVIIDAAHGGRSAGVSGKCGVEKNITLDLALRVRMHLAGAPFKVMLTREGDFELSVDDRLALARSVSGEAVFVSLHLGSGNPKARGLEIFTLPPPYTPATYDPPATKPDDGFYPGNINDRESLALAVAIQGQAVRQNLRTLGLKRARFDELKGISVPAVYCRAGFVSNKDDAALLGNPAHIDKMAKTIADGIRRYARVIEEGMEKHVMKRENDPLLISNVEVFADQVRSIEGEKRRVRLDIQARDSIDVEPEKLEVQVFFFDLVNQESLDLTTADPPETQWISILPDWKATDTEVMEVGYTLPAMSEEEQRAFGHRFYYGFVARLVYDGRLVDSYAEPANLWRGLPHFITVFP